MLAVSIVLTTVGLIAASKFSVLYRELGVQLPARSEEAMLLWFHLVALAMLLLPIVWRLRAGATSWATPVWFVSALFYVGYVILVLFMPLVGAMGVLGEQINPG
jgi:hypothetical protein